MDRGVTAKGSAPVLLVVQRLSSRWNSLTLAAQFMAVAAIVLTVGMFVVGNWIVSRIVDAVVHTHAVQASLYTDSIIEPLVQGLATADSLDPSVRQELDRISSSEGPTRFILGLRIWKGNTIVYSDRKELIGQRYETTPARLDAARGQVSADLVLGATRDHPTLDSGAYVLEIFAPVHRIGTGEIIAVAETDYAAPALAADLASTRWASWLLVTVATVVMLIIQFSVVLKGSRTIEDQRIALARRISELSRLLSENEQLQARVSEANRRVVEMNERYLRQIGADLHDGPVQMLSIAVLRLNSLSETIADSDPEVVTEAEIDIVAMRSALRESLDEIRSLSAGLAAPELEKLELSDVLHVVAQRHERRTGSPVICAIGDLPDALPPSIKYCIYRFAQEGLHNGYRHGAGRDQRLEAWTDGQKLKVVVLDQGPGLPLDAMLSSTGQGLVGLRDRIESLGGRFTADNRPEGGVVLTAEFAITEVSGPG